MNDKKQTHYYTYLNKQYENMLDVCTNHGLTRSRFRTMVKNKLIKKVTINVITPNGHAKVQEKAKAGF